MTKNRFTVLARLKAIRERQARVELASALHQERAATDELERRRRSLDDLVPESIPLSPTALLALHLRGIGTVEAIDAAAHIEAERREQTSLKREAWRRAAVDRDAAKELEHQRRAALARHAAKVAERALDEMAVLRVGRRL